MDDFEIVNLFWERDEKAISETSKKYGNYCKSIADSILHNDQDSKECENETYYRAWKSIPPHRPKVLSAFLGKIIRRIAFDKLRKSLIRFYLFIGFYKLHGIPFWVRSPDLQMNI